MTYQKMKKKLLNFLQKKLAGTGSQKILQSLPRHRMESGRKSHDCRLASRCTKLDVKSR